MSDDWIQIKNELDGKMYRFDINWLKKSLGISELEKKVKLQPIVNNNFIEKIAELRGINDVHSKAMVNLISQLTELKDILEGLMSGLLKEQTKRKKIEEVLRELKEGIINMLTDIKAHRGLRLHETIFLEKLAKLDKTEKKEELYRCADCGSFEIINHCKKYESKNPLCIEKQCEYCGVKRTEFKIEASGGEKEKEGSRVEVPNKKKGKIPQIELDNSKPPEPSKCSECGNVLNHFTKNIKGNLVCPICWMKPTSRPDDEPREDDLIIPEEEIEIIMNQIEEYISIENYDPIKKILTQHVIFKNFVSVKREDLQYLLYLLGYEYDEYTKDTKASIDRIKEEYNIE